MKIPTAALSTFALLPLALVAGGCGSGDTAASGPDATATARQASSAGSPGPASSCGQPTTTDLPRSGGEYLMGAIYISCIDQPVTLSAADVDPFDWTRDAMPSAINGNGGKGSGTQVRPGAFVVSAFHCNFQANSWGWQMGVTLADGSKASVRVQLRACSNTTAVRARFNTPEGQWLTSAVLTTTSGKRVRVVGMNNTSLPELELTRPAGEFARYMPIFIKAA